MKYDPEALWRKNAFKMKQQFFSPVLIKDLKVKGTFP